MPCWFINRYQLVLVAFELEMASDFAKVLVFICFLIQSGNGFDIYFAFLGPTPYPRAYPFRGSFASLVYRQHCPPPYFGNWNATGKEYTRLKEGYYDLRGYVGPFAKFGVANSVFLNKIRQLYGGEEEGVKINPNLVEMSKRRCPSDGYPRKTKILLDHEVPLILDGNGYPIFPEKLRNKMAEDKTARRKRDVPAIMNYMMSKATPFGKKILRRFKRTLDEDTKNILRMLLEPGLSVPLASIGFLLLIVDSAVYEVTGKTTFLVPLRGLFD